MGMMSQQYNKELNFSKSSSIHKDGNISSNSNKESLLSLSGSLDLDGYEIEDEVAAQLHDGRKKNTLDITSPTNGERIIEDVTGITDSLDLENSDDLNKIIQRYENMLGTESS